MDTFTKTVHDCANMSFSQGSPREEQHSEMKKKGKRAAPCLDHEEVSGPPPEAIQEGFMQAEGCMNLSHSTLRRGDSLWEVCLPTAK